MTAPQPQRELKWEPHWITPPEIYAELDAEFHFDYDPCPFPKPKDYDGIKSEWGNSNYVNPPFHRENGIGPTAFVRKAIEENKKGKTVVLTIPTQSYVNLLLEAGAEVRSLGRVKWLHTVTREPMKGPSPITAFILRNRPHTQAPEPCIMIEGIDGEMVNLLADDKEIYLDSFARFAKNPAVDMLIQMFRDKQQSLRTAAQEARR
jgi:hypothetical protein